MSVCVCVCWGGGRGQVQSTRYMCVRECATFQGRIQDFGKGGGGGLGNC